MSEGRPRRKTWLIQCTSECLETGEKLKAEYQIPDMSLKMSGPERVKNIMEAIEHEIERAINEQD